MNTKSGFSFDYVIGQGRKIKEIFEDVEKISAHDVPVLIEGESGTGKELIARAIHYNGPRKDKEFVVINCSAFPDALLESELFGHLKGSFTGAINEKKGLFEVADNGTFFLDEIADMSPALQVKLLRVLQEGTFMKIGGIEPITVNIRIIAASNKNLKSMVEKDEFREDLFYRINVTSIHLLPLRERKEDIEILIDYFLTRHKLKNEAGELQVTDKAYAALRKYDWPGNIRQLENEIERASIFAKNGVIDVDILSTEITEYEQRDNENMLTGSQGLNEIKKQMIEKIEKKVIYEGLEKTNWNKTECARLLRVSRGDLMRKIARYQIAR